MCVFCRFFEAQYGVPAAAALDGRRWREMDAVVGGTGKDLNRSASERRAQRRRERAS